MLGTGELPRRGPRMNGPALFALFPAMPVPRAWALADVSPAPLSDALRFILSSLIYIYSETGTEAPPRFGSAEPRRLSALLAGVGEHL